MAVIRMQQLGYHGTIYMTLSQQLVGVSGRVSLLRLTAAPAPAGPGGEGTRTLLDRAALPSGPSRGG
jgi:hypothetical protein